LVKTKNGNNPAKVSKRPQKEEKKVCDSRKAKSSPRNYKSEKELVEQMNFETVIHQISKVGINPTALCTETLIIILLKMEMALNNLLVKQNNQDY